MIIFKIFIQKTHIYVIDSLVIRIFLRIHIQLIHYVFAHIDIARDGNTSWVSPFRSDLYKVCTSWVSLFHSAQFMQA